MLNKKVCFFRPKMCAFLDKTLFGVKAMMASKKVFGNLFCKQGLNKKKIFQDMDLLSLRDFIPWNAIRSLIRKPQAGIPPVVLRP